jgi:hypothetical protein
VVRECLEGRHGERTVDPAQEAEPLTPGPPNIWELHPWAREAADAARAGQSGVVCWVFELRPEV